MMKGNNWWVTNFLAMVLGVAITMLFLGIAMFFYEGGQDDVLASCIEHSRAEIGDSVITCQVDE